MRLLVAFAALALPLSPASAERLRILPVQNSQVPMRPCEGPRVHMADDAGKGEAKRLGELPPGDLVLTVMRRTGHCFSPVIVRRGIGAAADQPETQVLPPAERPRRPKLIR